MMKVFQILILFFFASSAFSQQVWMRSYGGDGYDEAHAAVQLEDSSYIITGTTSSFYNTDQNVLFLSVDSSGEFIHSNFVNNGGIDAGKKIIRINDYKYWIAGHTNSTGNGGFDAYLLKVDSLGNKLEDYTYGGSDWDFFNDMIMLSDSSLILVGETQSFGAGNKDGYIVKVDKNGDTLWTRTVGFAGDDWLKSVIVFNDTLYLAGASEDIASDTTFGMFTSYTTNGDSIFTRKLAYSETQEFNDIVWFFPWGHIYVLGRSWSGTDFNYWFYMVDASGNYLDNNIYGSPDTDDNINCAAVYGNTLDMIVAGPIEGAPFIYPNGHDLLVARTSPGGWYQNGWIFGNHDPDDGNDVIRTSDGGALIVGTTRSYAYNWATGGSNVYLIKMGVQDSIPDNAIYTLDPITTSVNEYQFESLEFYPNPTRNEINFKIPELGKEKFEMSIHDINGKVLVQGALNSNSIDLSSFDSGLYFLSIVGNNHRYLAKIIKE